MVCADCYITTVAGGVLAIILSSMSDVANKIFLPFITNYYPALYKQYCQFCIQELRISYFYCKPQLFSGEHFYSSYLHSNVYICQLLNRSQERHQPVLNLPWLIMTDLLNIFCSFSSLNHRYFHTELDLVISMTDIKHTFQVKCNGIKYFYRTVKGSVVPI